MREGEGKWGHSKRKNTDQKNTERRREEEWVDKKRGREEVSDRLEEGETDVL